AVAEQAIALIPLAFGRELLERMAVRAPLVGVVVDGAGGDRDFRLDQNPIFRDARLLAQNALNRGYLTRDQFESIALRSAEVKVLNKAMHDGSKPEDMVIAPPMFPASSDWDLAPLGTPIPPALPAVSAPKKK